MADELNFQIPQEGFDSYLYGIIPDDQAVLAGAFSVAMQQVKNIQAINIEQFAQVAYSMENLAGLPFTAGTDIPTDLVLATFAKSQTALGAGVYGTFTNSNFFGCMSGLPYPLKAIYDGIKQLETQTLTSIYQNLYLAVTWNAPSLTVVSESREVEVSPGVYVTEYRVSSVTINNRGGGYGRGSAPAPSLTFDNGATASCTIGTDPNEITGPNPLFGKITDISVTSPGSWQSTPPTVTIQYPPNTYPGGSNSPYGTTFLSPNDMNTVINNSIQSYVTAANNEIQSIKQASASNFKAATVLDTNWNITGTALKQEQRARYNFIPPVPIPYDRWLNISPTALYVFVDSIPDMATKTLPHMASQTLEHISNLKNTGGQSVVGMMRQERNQDRLQEIGIELDNNLPDRLSVQLEKILLTNGTLPLAVDGIPSPTGRPYTLPAWPSVEVPLSGSPCDNDVVTQTISPDPVAIFNVNTQTLEQITGTGEGNILPILENTCLGPFGNGSGPLIPKPLPPGLPPPSTQCGEIPTDLAEELGFTPCVGINDEIPVIVVNTKTPLGPTPPLGIPGGPAPGSYTGTPTGIPSNIGSNLPAVVGPDNTLILGSLNLQPPTQILPPSLDTSYTGTTLMPSTYDINDAIDKVIECNCDCWVN